MPSSGSMIQRCSDSVAAGDDPLSSPRNACDGIGVAKGADDGFLGRVVDFGDEVVVLLAAHGEAVEVGRGASDDRAGLARSLHGGGEHRMHGKERGRRGSGEAPGSVVRQNYTMKANSPLSRVAVVLSRTSHPGNIGAAARAMKTMGLRDLLLVSPRHFPHPEATAMAAGAADVLESARVVRDARRSARRSHAHLRLHGSRTRPVASGERLALRSVGRDRGDGRRRGGTRVRKRDIGTLQR